MFFAPRDPRAKPTTLPRSVAAFAAVGAGFVGARYLPGTPAAVWLSVACAACAIAALLRGRSCRVALAIAATAFGGGWFALRIHEAPARNLDLLVPPRGAPALLTVEGIALEPGRVLSVQRGPLHPMAHLQEPGARFTVRVDAVRSGEGAEVHVRGRIRVLAPSGSPRVVAGERLRVSGEFRPVPPPMNPGEPDRRLWAAQDGEAGTLRAASGTLIQSLGAEHRSSLTHAYATLLSWRESLREGTRRALFGDSGGAGDPSESRALLAALLLGEEEPALQEARSAFTRLGLAHALAISGFHLTVMAAVVLFALRLTGDRGWIEPGLVAGLVAIYLVILPVQAPIWRSGLMTLGLLAADAIGRRYDPLAILGWIAVGLLLWRPMDLWAMGFQLSFGMVALLMWLGESTYRRLYGIVYAGPTFATARPLPLALIEHLRMYVSSSLLCWAAAVPLVAYHTGLVSAAGLPASLILLPPMLLLLAAGYAALAGGLLFPPLAEYSGAFLDNLSAWTIFLVRWMDALPYTSFTLPWVSLAWAVCATVVLLYCFARAHARDGLAWCSIAVTGIWLALEVVLGPRLSAGTPLRIDTLAVGDGTCHLLRSGREALLWDCGSLTPGAGRRIVPRAVRALGAWRVPTVIISHPNLDHFNGLVDAARPLGVRQVLVSRCFLEQAEQQPMGPEAFLIAALGTIGVEVMPIAAGDRISLGSAELRILGPPPHEEQQWSRDNDRSLVAQVVVQTPRGQRGLLLTGDIQHRAIEYLYRAHPGLRASIMEAPHHGSAHDPAIKFVAAIDPEVVLQSTGPDRAADERWDTVRRFRDWYTTALDGAAWAEIRSDGSIGSGAMWRR